MNPGGFTLVGSVEVDRYHLYDGETTTIEVKVCNTSSEHPVIYWVEYVDTFDIFVSGRHGGAGSVGDLNDAPMRYEDVPAGECRGRVWTWDPATDNSYHVKDGIFEVRGTFLGKDPDEPSGSGGIGEIDPVFVEVHDGPRPAGAEPPPPTGFPPPEWSLHIRTDADRYAPGDTVAITVEWCNETDVEQEYSDSSLSDYEFDVMIFLRHDDGSIDEIAWLDTNQRSGTGTGEYQYLQPGECMGDTVFWHGTAGAFKGDGASDGATVGPGSYLLRAWKSTGPYGAYTKNREAETTLQLIAA